MLYPKIGIRPVIDGRWGGVRESLENQTVRIDRRIDALEKSRPLAESIARSHVNLPT